MRYFAIVLFVVLLVPPFFGGSKERAAEPAQQAQEFEIVPVGNGDWARVLGVGVWECVLDGKSIKSNWMAFSHGQGEDIIWFLGCRLPEVYLEQIGKTVDADTTVNRPWKVTISKDGKQTAVHTSYRWVSRFCGVERQPDKQCDVRQVLDEPIRTFRTFEFVKKWEVKEYLPKKQ